MYIHTGRRDSPYPMSGAFGSLLLLFAPQGCMLHSLYSHVNMGPRMSIAWLVHSCELWRPCTVRRERNKDVCIRSRWFRKCHLGVGRVRLRPTDRQFDSAWLEREGPEEGTFGNGSERLRSLFMSLYCPEVHLPQFEKSKHRSCEIIEAQTCMVRNVYANR